MMPSLLSAQDYVSVENANPKLTKNYDRVKKLINIKEYDKALERLDKILKSEPEFIDALILRSEILYANGNTADAIGPLEESIDLDSLYNTRNLYSLARLYELDEQYALAVKVMLDYTRLGKLSVKRQDEIALQIVSLAFKDSLVRSPVAFAPVPLPGYVNTDADEALPAVTIDGKRMVFTRRENGDEDLYYTRWNAEEQNWGEGIPMTSINSILNEGAHAISADGSVVAFTSCNRKRSIGSCDIYVARQHRNGQWTPAANPEELNSTAWDGQPALTADGRGMYFSSSRKGGQGNKDLWYSELQTNGRWSMPVNCGPVINTKGNESSPFLHYDDRTLYFMSDGHPGMGDYDIFTSFKATGDWSKPQNLGYPINTTMREGGLSVHPDGHTAYFTVESEAGGTMDIYQFDLPLKLQPGVISYLTGLVYDNSTKMPVEAAISIYALRNPEEAFAYRVRSDGTFTAALVHGQPYGLHVTAPGYAFYSLQFEFDSVRPYGNEELRIPLQPIKELASSPPEPVVLHNVEFESGSSTLLASSYSELELLLKLLSDNQDIRIQIQGHTDNVGDPESNQTLSEHRAKAVYDWLVQKTISSERITYKGFGETRPIDSNDKEEGRQINRRTEFVIENQ
jgi:outer membrane protein OmpA-like peptidoglycan-associated protein